MSVLGPVLRPVLLPVLQPLAKVRRGRTLGSQVLAMFASGEKGVMYDVVNPANLYQDSARTTPVTTSGDLVGSVTDLSPNAKHGSSAGTARPTWNSAGYATFDAFDDYWATAAIDFTATDAVTVVVGLRKLSDAATGVVAELGPVVANAWFVIGAPSGSSSFSYICTGTGGVNATASAGVGSYPAPTTRVITTQSKISTDLCSLRVDGVAVSSSANDQGAGNYQNAALYMGARGGTSVFLSGRIYRLLIIGRALTTTERNLAERWAAQPTGIVIP